MVTLTPLYGPLFRHRGRNFDTHALFCKKDADYCKRDFESSAIYNHKGSNFLAPINKFVLSEIV